jgi:chemotaxis protein methyltransferase CheR
MAVLERMDSSLSAEDFERLSELITGNYGIKMPEVKRTMLESRLRKRLRMLKMDTFEQYCDLLFSDKGQEEELQNMVDVVTTNKTEFFREDRHFDYLSQNVLPELGKRSGSARFWSSACSSGEEPYTLAMVLSEHSSENEEFDFSILATDLSVEMLEKAHLGVYKEERVRDVPEQLRKKYMMEGKGSWQGFHRVTPDLRKKVTFRGLNLMDEVYEIDEPMDVIFCRNVLIYFDRKTQERILTKLAACLNNDGYMFLGHSETVTGLKVPLKQIAPTVYKLR